MRIFSEADNPQDDLSVVRSIGAETYRGTADQCKQWVDDHTDENHSYVVQKAPKEKEPEEK